MNNVTAVILAGGKGTRLEPLTRQRAKPAVPFGGIYRIIDFTLSNCLNSGLRRVFVLTQYKARSLDKHVRRGWNFLATELGEGIEVLPPQQRTNDYWYRGTADAIYQNIYSLEAESRDYTLILAGDHIYKMDYSEMVKYHIEKKASLTVGCIPIPLEECDQFGVMSIDSDYKITSFLEKPKTASPMPGATDRCLGSMGIYVFNTDLMFDLLLEDGNDPDSSHDFGKDIIPKMIAQQSAVYAYPFRDRNSSESPHAPYWRDVGTLDAYYQANLDLIEALPVLNLYDETWPIRTLHDQWPPPKFVHDGVGRPGEARRGEAIESIISPGCIISGGHVSRSILSPNVRVNSYAVVEESILFEGVRVGRNCRIKRAIIDKNVDIPPETVIGHDLEADRLRGFTISEKGVVVIPKGEPRETFTGQPR